MPLSLCRNAPDEHSTIASWIGAYSLTGGTRSMGRLGVDRDTERRRALQLECSVQHGVVTLDALRVLTHPTPSFPCLGQTRVHGHLLTFS